MTEELDLLADGYGEASIQSTLEGTSITQQVQVRNEKKRSASEHPEQSTAKAARLAAGNEDESYSELEMKVEPDEKDEKISMLKESIRNIKARISKLEVELEDCEEEKRDAQIRCNELLSRETLRLDKEKLVETNARAAMKLAAKKMEDQLKAASQEKEKQMKQRFKTKEEDMSAKFTTKLKQHDAEASAKLQKERKESTAKINQLKADHKEEVRDLKELHKEEIKKYKPDHSKAMKEKVGELKAKDQKIASLEKSVQSTDALMAEKETLADQVDKEKSKNRELLKKIERFQKANEDIQGQYKHKLGQEGQKWQIQHDQAESAKAELMSQQRSNFALRGELTNKAQKIHFLENQLQNVQVPAPIATANAIIQTSSESNTSTNGESSEETAEVSNIYQPSAPALSAIDHTMKSMI